MTVLVKYFAFLVSISLLVGCTLSPSGGGENSLRAYDSIDRGSYRGSFYQVEKGDTLYFIAYITDKDVRDLIRFNRLKSPYVIYPGQRLKLWGPSHQTGHKNKKSNNNNKLSSASPAKVVSVAKSSASAPAQPQSPKNQPASLPKTAKKVDQNQKITYSKQESKENVNKASSASDKSSAGRDISAKTASNAKVSSWLWPTKGKVIRGFSSVENGNKGLDITGRMGQPIKASANGFVVYAGNALRGYGNLVIIKHNDVYLSAYAHNQKLLVKEGQSVKAGQTIATMGRIDANSEPTLHFEIRYQGKSVNPSRYLP